MISKQVALFPPELRTASIVPRWSVVWTLTRDTVANHSYYVAMYATSIALLIGWRSDKPIWHCAMLYRALTHDLDETITGDIVSPVKAEILDRGRYDDYVNMQMQNRLPSVVGNLEAINLDMSDEASDECWSIIAVADRLDALLFLIWERRMGNGVIAPRIPSAMARLQSAWYELPAPKDQLDLLWNTVMVPAIRNHEDQGGNGV